jgi:hypothetical protein
LSASSIILVQEIASWSERGSATASFLFARTLGNTFGASLFGAVLNFGLMHSAGHVSAISSEDIRRLLERNGGGAAGDPALRAALEQSLHLTFVSMFVIALFVAMTAALVPKVTFAAREAPAE